MSIENSKSLLKASKEAFIVSNTINQPVHTNSSHNKAVVFAMVAGEASGDTLGANLIQELIKRYPQAKFVGIGGPKMQALGFESWYPMEWLSIMGFFEVLKSLRKLLKLRKELTGRLISLEPDAFIGIDAPDFNFTLEKNLKQAGIPAVHYVGPSVWAWREKRLNKIRESVSGVLVLFPFEPPIYQRYQIPVQYVGHPLAAKRIGALSKVDSCAKLQLDDRLSYTAVLVGSRSSEIEQMAPVYLEVVEKLHYQYPEMQFVFPVVNEHAKIKIEELAYKNNVTSSIHCFVGHMSDCLQLADQALVTSGTASLECALYELPMVIAIKVHPISYWIMKRLATTQWVGLPNVLEQKNLVSECIQDQANAIEIFQHMTEVIENQTVRATQISAFKKQYQVLNVDSAKLAADAINQWALKVNQ